MKFTPKIRNQSQLQKELRRQGYENPGEHPANRYFDTDTGEMTTEAKKGLNARFGEDVYQIPKTVVEPKYDENGVELPLAGPEVEEFSTTVLSRLGRRAKYAAELPEAIKEETMPIIEVNGVVISPDEADDLLHSKSL